MNFTKVKEWAKNHVTEIALAGLGIGGLVAGYILGHDSGYVEGLTKFRELHCETMKDAIDKCGAAGAYSAIETYINGIEEQDWMNAAHELFYSRADIEKLIDLVKD